MRAAYWSSFGQEGNLELLKANSFEVLDCEISEGEDGVRFGWFIVRATR